MPFPGMRTGYKAPKPTNPLQGIADWAVEFTGPTAGVPYGRSAAAQEISSGRVEGVTTSTLGGKPVQWMGGRWVPLLTEGEQAREEQARIQAAGVRPEGSMATLGGKPVTWMDNRWTPSPTEGEMARKEQARIRANAPAAPVLPPYAGATPAPYVGSPAQRSVPIVQAEDDAYRQLLSQYGGLAKSGKQEEAEKLGMEIWNKKYGKTAMAQPGGAVGQVNPLMADMFGRQSSASAAAPSYAGVQAQPLGSEDFSRAANSVPAPWNQQGAQVSSDFAGVVPFQAAKTTGSGMPAFQTTKAIEFLTNMKLRNSF